MFRKSSLNLNSASNFGILIFFIIFSICMSFLIESKLQWSVGKVIHWSIQIRAIQTSEYICIGVSNSIDTAVCLSSVFCSQFLKLFRLLLGSCTEGFKELVKYYKGQTTIPIWTTQLPQHLFEILTSWTKEHWAWKAS